MPVPASRQRIRSRTDDRIGRRKRVAQLRAGGMAVADIAAELGCSGRTVLRDLKEIRAEMPTTLSHDDKQGIVADLIARQDHIRSLVWQEVDRASTSAAKLRALNHARRAEVGYMELLVSLGVIGPVDEKVAPAPPEPLPWDAHTRDRIARALLYSGLSALPEPELDDEGASSSNR